MKRYVLGFCFDPALTRVLLIHKTRAAHVPEFTGTINGVGGRVEPGEDPTAAVIREFREEVGLANFVDWVRFAALSSEDYEVSVFRATLDFSNGYLHETEEGGVSSYPVEIILHPDHQVHFATDLAWLVPMALQHLRGRGLKFYDIWQGSGERAPGAEWPPAIDSVAAPSGVRNMSTTLPSGDCGRHLRTGFGSGELRALKVEVELRNEIALLNKLVRAMVSR